MFTINCFRINGSWNKTELQKNQKKPATTKKHSHLKLMVGITQENHIQSLKLNYKKTTTKVTTFF